MPEETPSLGVAAQRAGVSPATLRRWAEQGLIPQYDGSWTAAAVNHARLVARLRRRGYGVESIRAATESGRLAFGYLEDMLGGGGERLALDAAALACGLEPGLVERIVAAVGLPLGEDATVAEGDVPLLRYVAGVLEAGFPLVALLQIARVYGQALAQVADAEVRLFNMYVHEPLIRDGVLGSEIAEEMQALAGELLPLTAPMMDHLHRRYLSHFVEQEAIAHMETDLGAAQLDLGRLRVAIVFADLAGYTRLTEEEGEEHALNAVERFVETVTHTLPDDARVIKTIGDGVMVVGSDPSALTDWAVGLQELMPERPQPRIGIHYGETVYRDGDYYGREVNLAARVAARSAGGEVLVTRPVVEQAGAHLEFEPIGEVKLKGFNTPTELFLARVADDD